MVTLKHPSQIKHILPMGSVFRKIEYEVIARNICKILARTGDTFRELSWEEYRAEREKDAAADSNNKIGAKFNISEKYYFDDVAPYFKDAGGPPLIGDDYVKDVKPAEPQTQQ